MEIYRYFFWILEVILFNIDYRLFKVSKSKLSSWIEETKKQNLGIAPSRPADKIVETGAQNLIAVFNDTLVLRWCIKDRKILNFV